MVLVEDIDGTTLVFLVRMHQEQVHYDEVVESYDLSCRWIRESIHHSQGVVLQQLVLVVVVELDEYA